MADPISLILGTALTAGESLLGAIGLGAAGAGTAAAGAGAAAAGTAAAAGGAAALSPLTLLGLGAAGASLLGGGMSTPKLTLPQTQTAAAPTPTTPGAKAAPPQQSPQGSASSLRPASGPSFLSAAAVPQQQNTANKSLLGQ